MVRWKVCGIRDAESAATAVAAGADAIGFVFYRPSPRAVEPELAAEIAATLPRSTWRVGVFVDETPAEIERIVEVACLDFIQLSGDEDPAICAELPRHALKALRLAPGTTTSVALQLAARYSDCTLLVDTAVPGEYGGTGQAADWEAAAALASRYRLMLAGGLDARNLPAAIDAVKPWAVDVSSGVESSPGVKEADMIKDFGLALERYR